MFDEKLVINKIFLQGMMNSGHKGSKKFVHKGPFFHPTSTRVFQGPGASTLKETWRLPLSLLITTIWNGSPQPKNYHNTRLVGLSFSLTSTSQYNTDPVNSLGSLTFSCDRTPE